MFVFLIMGIASLILALYTHFIKDVTPNLKTDFFGRQKQYSNEELKKIKKDKVLVYAVGGMVELLIAWYLRGI